MFLVASLQTAQQLRLIERADAPVPAGSPRSRARPFFRGIGQILLTLFMGLQVTARWPYQPPMWTMLREGLINPASPM